LIAKLRDVRHTTSIVVTHRLQDGYALANFIYAPDKKALVPAPTNGAKSHSPPTRFLLLRDGGIYFQGNGQELANSPDPYLRKFLA